MRLECLMQETEMQTAVSSAVPAPTPPEPRSPRLYLVGGTHAVLVSFDQV